MLSEQIQAALLNAEAKALATIGPAGLNVVPVSVIDVTEDNIFLFDFFMGKTVENIQAEAQVALTAWAGLTGVQVRATAEYISDGEVFDVANETMKEQYPERVLKGVLVLTPKAVYDVTADRELAGTLLAS
jgi:predicted pyridoxine 5'-phosphate oxidase superfamily flavin-nucleotide-binding protein